MLGGFLALLSAATFAINNVSARRGVITASVEQGLAITIPIGVPLFALAMTLAGSWATLFGFSSKAVWLLAIAGILHFVWARYCFYRATKALGTMLVAPLQQLSMFLALLLAMIFLGEKLTPLRFFGLVLVIGGPILAFSSRGQVLSAPSTTSFRPNYVEGYFWGILSATGSCISPILIRLAIQDGGAGAGLAGGFISYTAATVIFIIVIVAAGRTAHVLSMERTNAYWFANAGFFRFCLAYVSILGLCLRTGYCRRSDRTHIDIVSHGVRLVR